MNQKVRCLLEHLQAAQTVVALYESGGDKALGFLMLAQILNAVDLLKAQADLGICYHEFVILDEGTILIKDRSAGRG